MSYKWNFNNLSYNEQFYVSSGGFEQTDPNHSYGPLGRSGYMLHCITGGHGIFKSNGIVYHLKKGDMFYVEPHKTVFMQADEDDPWSFYWVRWIGNLVPRYMHRVNISNINPIMYKKDLPTVYQNVIDIVEHSKTSGHHDFYYQAKMFEILDQLEEAYPRDFKQNKIPQGVDLYHQAVSYIQNNYDSQMNVTDLVAYLNIDRTYLYRIFKKNSNQSPEQFIIDYRLKRASELLKSDSGTISYIALSSGFQSYQSFNRLFRKRYQISPTEFRKKYNTKTNKR